jgi:integrase
MTVKRDRNGRWRYRKVVKMPDGSTVRISGTPTINTKLETERAERDHIERTLHPPAQPKEVPTFNQFADEFMATYVRNNNKPSEQEAKRSMFEQHLRPAFGRRRLDEIGVRDVEALKARLLQGGRGPKRVNNVLACLGKLLRYAAEIDVLPNVPRIKFLKVPPQKFDFLTVEEYERLLAAIRDDPERYAMIAIAGESGMRKGEILGLQWDDVDFRAGALTVRRSIWHNWREGSKEHVGSPKSGRDRVVPLSRRATEVLRSVRHLRGARVFCEASGIGLTPAAMEAALNFARKRAGLRQIGWHVLRHTFCSHLAMLGAAPKAIQELAGHSTLSMTLRYMHLAPGAHREAVALLDRRRGNSVATDERAVAK